MNFPNKVNVLRTIETSVNGAAAYSWSVVMRNKDVRLDLSFLRPGRDIPSPLEAGTARDRVGICFAPPTLVLKPGDRLQCVSGPVAGTFQVEDQPDGAQGYASLHHYEIFVKEVAQAGLDRS